MALTLTGRWGKIFWGLAALGALWSSFLGALTHPWLQRQALYAHKLHSAWWEDLDAPEKWGFLKSQIRPFNFSTPDGELLYGWHILPLDVYSAHEEQLLKEPKVIENYRDSIAYKALTSDPSSRVVVNFHGNAGHVGQGWRTDCYRTLALGTPKLHVFAFDYRGFGYSSGSPSESGLITDGIAAVDWVLDTTKVKPDALGLVGQSLGTAVASSVAEHFVQNRSIEFAGLVLISPFTGLVNLLQTYSIGKFIPIFSPLAPYPKIQRWFESKVLDTWHTSSRVANFVRLSKRPRLYIIHSKDDFDIHWTHSETLFHVAANATSKEGLSAQQITSIKYTTDLGAEGKLYSWVAEGDSGQLKKIAYLLLKYGGHNRITSYPAVSKTVLELFNPKQ